MNKLKSIYNTVVNSIVSKWDKPIGKGNAMMHLNLYKTGTTWQFDDATFNIVAEPFVLGMSEIISSYFNKNKKKCKAIFSLEHFPGCDTLTLDQEDAGGGWYTVTDTNNPKALGMKGWLCPVTRVYLHNIPVKIYYKLEK
jgi:hypothetical protein